MLKFSFFPSGWTTRGLVVVCLFITLVWACQQEDKISETMVEEKGIEELMKNLEAMKQEAVSPLEGIHTSYQQLQAASSEFKKSDEEIRQDLLSLGIIRVHQVLRGENPSVKPKDTQEFIRYIKEQVQNALISQDKNYKAIVFKGIESSA